MILDYASLFGGLAILLVAGDILVRGSVSLAQSFGIPAIVIGLTIVAFGTSAPELVISLRAALEGAGGIAVGNVVGSNIANVLLVLGLPSLLAATHCGEEGSVKSAIFMIAVSLVFILFCYFPPLGLPAGLALLFLLIIFLAESVRSAHRARREGRAARDAGEELLEEVEGLPKEIWLASLFVFAGLIALPAGANFTIDGAVSIARSWHVSDAAIALTIIALGTSLPELATTLMSAVRGQAGVAVGNVIGSNIFNLLAIMGTVAVITPVSVPAEIMSFDIWAMLGASVLLLLFAAMSVTLKRVSGFALVAIYGGYIALVFLLGRMA